MTEDKKPDTRQGNFYLNKWFLDFVGEGGETMIFYAAKLRWRGWSVPYTSWLWYEPDHGISNKYRFRKINMPEKKDQLITWLDSDFGVEGEWKSMTKPLEARLFNSKDGYLDWNCFQPASRVQLRINNKTIEGQGYAEQLILTSPPWKILMDELRWGRFGSKEHQIVWIEIRTAEKQQWLWLNGDKIGRSIIEDDHISIPEKDIFLQLDRKVILESEKKISSVVEKLFHYLPGFNKVMPLKFLMADEIKWLSKGELQIGGKNVAEGMAIHELVNFKPTLP